MYVIKLLYSIFMSILVPILICFMLHSTSTANDIDLQRPRTIHLVVF